MTTIICGDPFRVVLDTNVLLRGLIAEGSVAARIVQAAEKRLFIPLLSKPVISEQRTCLCSGHARSMIFCYRP